MSVIFIFDFLKFAFDYFSVSLANFWRFGKIKNSTKRNPIWRLLDNMASLSHVVCVKGNSVVRN